MMTPRVMTPEQARDALAAGDALLIDVREPDEFKAGHIAYAVSVPLGGLKEHMAQLALPVGRKVIFQCQKGGRGGQACAAMGAVTGSVEMFNIEGGIEAWKAAGLPVIGGDAVKVTIFRQVQMVVGSLVAVLVALGFMGVTVCFVLAGLMGLALAVAGMTGWCGLAMLLAKMPWNR